MVMIRGDELAEGHSTLGAALEKVHDLTAELGQLLRHHRAGTAAVEVCRKGDS